MPRVQHQQVVGEGHRIRMTSLESESPFNDVLEADEGELGETIDFSGMAHGRDEMADGVVGAV